MTSGTLITVAPTGAESSKAEVPALPMTLEELVTTAKDAVKIHETATPETWWVLDIALELENGPSFHTWVLNQIQGRAESG